MFSNSLDNNENQFLNVHEALKKFFRNPSMYPTFPNISDFLKGESGLLRKEFSIYKKGTSYFIIDDNKSEYKETLEDISHSPIIFHFTQWELDSSHIGELIRFNTAYLIDNSMNVEQYEEALKTVLSKNMYNNFPQNIQRKLEMLNTDLSFPGVRYLEGISLILHESGNFIVLDTEVDFSRNELEQIKEAVFV